MRRQGVVKPVGKQLGQPPTWGYTVEEWPEPGDILVVLTPLARPPGVPVTLKIRFVGGAP